MELDLLWVLKQFSLYSSINNVIVHHANEKTIAALQSQIKLEIHQHILVGLQMQMKL